MISGYDKAAFDLLTFYREAGVDVALGEEPVDRFADVDLVLPAVVEPARSEAIKPLPAGLPQSNRTAPLPLPRTAAPPPPDEAIMAARAAAKSATSL